MFDRAMLSRRDFVATSGSCLAYLTGTAAFVGPGAIERWLRPRRLVVAQEPWGRLEDVGPDAWALISTPLTGDYTTISNGGIIAGRSGVIVVEGTGSIDGARWMAERARALTGRFPTNVIVTHHHGDHTAGVSGLGTPPSLPKLHATVATRDRVSQGFDADAEPGMTRPWADMTIVGVDGPTQIDLGDRTAVVRPFDGHTESDLIVDLPEQGITWCGDLVWNEMFPNYVDATPSRLGSAVRAIRDDGRSTHVPGHGPLADAQAMSTYLSILDDIEEAARNAIAAGRSAEDAGAAYSLPAGVGEWTLFNPEYFARAIGAWMRELAG